MKIKRSGLTVLAYRSLTDNHYGMFRKQQGYT